MTGMRVLVSIPALNEVTHIEAVVRGLAAEKAELPGLEIVVCDGGSRDGTQVVMARLADEMPFVHLLEYPAPPGTPARNINYIAWHWRDAADVMIRCDAHAIYPPRYLARLLEALARTGATSVVVPMDSTGRTCLQKAIAWVSDTPVGSGGSAHRGGRQSGFIDHGHHAAFHMAPFIAARGYDEAMPSNEDAELDKRLIAMGGGVYLDAEIRIGYFPRARFAALWRQYYTYGLGRSMTVLRHHRIRMRQFAVPLNLVLLVASVAAALLQSWLLLFWPILYLLILVGTGIMLAIRHQCVCGLLAAPAAFVIHTSYALGFLRGLAKGRAPNFSSLLP